MCGKIKVREYANASHVQYFLAERLFVAYAIETTAVFVYIDRNKMRELHDEIPITGRKAVKGCIWKR